MAYSDQISLNKSISHANSTSIFSQARRKLSFRRKKLPVIQLGAGGKKHRRRFLLLRIFRRVRILKGLKLHYSNMAKKIKEFYWSAVNDILEGNEAVDTFHRGFVLQSSFAIPMLGLTPNAFSNRSVI
ncbi:uncharacterized protein [Solanum tuberosum]|uniref:Uncharacterized protein n=1 Tax=Solanum tuberosum TaxID=4113 RepID=M1C3M1_SOLTU|nr:PREDICTED: uncharacterized protein LOC102578607 [Solanum tuberosum]